MNLISLTELKESVAKLFPTLWKGGSISVRFDSRNRVFCVYVYKIKNPNNNDRIDTVESLRCYDCISQIAPLHYLGKDENNKNYFAFFAPYEVNV